MITLYSSLGCLHCTKVIETLDHEIGEDFIVRYISKPENRKEVEKGGKLQVPYLVDEEADTSLYEADDIVAYLKKQYKSSS
ncbi:glutathione S-transferase N-terminal domain-containing protein [Patescibacteria group bacterium]|nr:glutathione S-transferase N-terminal domain-containing protein [Patescibacteria group bacterium]